MRGATWLFAATLVPAWAWAQSGSQGPEAGGAARPIETCSAYCAAVMANCTGDNAQYTDPEKCHERCRAEGWDVGELGTKNTDTLACRGTWALLAKSDPASACRNAGASSPMCIAGQPIPVAPPLDPAANTVIGLYDSRDGAEGERGQHARKVVLAERLDRALQSRGLVLVLHDLRKGLPDNSLVKESTAIVTCMYDGVLPGAKAYLLWLVSQIDAGRKVVILNDLGAFRDEAAPEGQWLPDRFINLVFEPLGVRYRGDWTGDGKVLRTVQGDASLFHQKRLPKAETANHYFMFERVSPDAKAHLLVRRTDRKDSQPSAVVVTGPRGGMALTRYYEDLRDNELLDLSAFFDRIMPPKR